MQTQEVCIEKSEDALKFNFHFELIKKTRLNKLIDAFIYPKLKTNIESAFETSKRDFQRAIFWLFLNCFSISGEIADPTFTVSFKGNRQLIHNGYTYTKNVSKGKRVFWRCTFKENRKYTCKASAVTYDKYEVNHALFSGKHNHPPSKKVHNELDITKTV